MTLKNSKYIPIPFCRIASFSRSAPFFAVYFSSLVCFLSSFVSLFFGPSYLILSYFSVFSLSIFSLSDPFSFCLVLCVCLSLDFVHVVNTRGERCADLAELLPTKFLGNQGERIRQKLVVYRNNDNVQPLWVFFSTPAAKGMERNGQNGTEQKSGFASVLRRFCLKRV